MPVVYSNNASTSLSSGITNSDTSITVGSVSSFPVLSGGDYYYATLANVTNTKIEIIKVTNVVGSVLTVLRGQDGTTAVSFDANDNVQLRVTSATLEAATKTDVDITGGAIASSIVDSAGAVMESDSSTASMSFVLDEDTMVSNSATKLPTQQSVKAYVDSQVQSKDALSELSGSLDDIADGSTYVKSTNDFTDTDHSKLDGIETGATADQSNSEIKTAYEANANTNAFSDAEQTKLSGIATSANNYSHPTHPGDDFSVDTGALTGATVVSDIDINVTTDTSGHVTDANGTVATRTLTLADLGYTGATNANYITNNNQLTNGAGYITSYTNTTYTADGDYGMTLSGTTFRLEDDRRRNSTTTDIYSGNTHDYTWYDADVGIRWHTAGAEDMRLTDAGDLHVDGNVTAYSTTISDKNLKTDIKNIDNALDKVNKLNGCTFTYTSDGKKSAGLIAQEVEEVLPSAVTTSQLVFHGEEGKEYKVLQYDQTIGLLVEAIKELSVKVEELENK